VHAGELPEAEPGEQGDHQHRQHPAERSVAAAAHRVAHSGCDNAGAAIRARARNAVMNDSLKTLLLIAFLIVILSNLGAGL
jgi:hypothetical protein